MKFAILAILALLLPSHPLDEPDALAPDGRPGFGTGTELGDLLQRFRTPDKADTALFTELATLGADLRVAVSATEGLYRAKGYFGVVAAGGMPTLGDLHAAYAGLEIDPVAAVNGTPEEARAFARLFVDTRFRVRRGLIDGWEQEADEVRRGVAVLSSAAHGYVTLDERQAANVARRIDLAAAVLRSMRSDLSGLRETSATSLVPGARGGDGAGATDGAEVDAFLATFQIGDRRVRDRAVAAAIDAEAHMVEQMTSVLFTERLRESASEAFRWRAESDALARALLEEAQVALPDRENASEAPRDIVRLSKTKRRRLAREKAIEGLAQNPLDEELAWVAGVTSRLVFGELEMVSHFDRFLALRSIVYSDDRTFRGRKLSDREAEALYHVQQFDQKVDVGGEE